MVATTLRVETLSSEEAADFNPQGSFAWSIVALAPTGVHVLLSG